MVKRLDCPSPWEDAVAYAYELYWLAPNLAAAKYGITIEQMKQIYLKCRKKKRKQVKAA